MTEKATLNNWKKYITRIVMVETRTYELDVDLMARSPEEAMSLSYEMVATEPEFSLKRYRIVKGRIRSNVKNVVWSDKA